MTTPNGSAPDGAYVVGGRYGQDITESSAKSIMSGKTKSAFGNAQNQHKINVGNPLSALFGLAAGLRGDVDNQSVNQIKLENRVEQLLSGGTRYTYMLSTTWTNPGPGKLVGVAVFNAGRSGSSSNSNQSLNIGGEGAKYVFQEWKSDDLPSSVSITVATTAGGVSRFGTYLTGSWSGGGVMTAQGILSSAGDAGNGGRGDFFDSDNDVPGTAGTGNALAAGGVYTQMGNGGQGVDAPTTKIAVAGGGGGAGAGRPTVNTTRSAGAGGWPGGGGGAAGYASVILSSKNSGAGAPGAVFVTVRG